MKKIVVIKYALRLFCEIKAIHSSIAFGHAIKMDSVQESSALKTVVGPQQSSTIHPYAKDAPKEDHGGGLVIVGRSDSFQLPEFRGNHRGRQVLSKN
ncbi:hypothetical protein AVEN_209313-1 [Araneus ventricosus]|uniref:Uncharacterized protein n=1 Tax=Araneus ventricosus TaxID=182803 RepID=A0A4Y2CAZ0_ARAVE|nr:hypothetical protein AVEN_209313-1 [Araneus ventricosus]